LIKRSFLDRLAVRNPEDIVQVSRFDVNGEANSFTYPLYREMAAAGAPF
jgi:hypothetical protein